MAGNNKLGEFNIKDCSYHYLDNIIDINDLFLKNAKVDKNDVTIFLLTALDMKHHMG